MALQRYAPREPRPLRTDGDADARRRAAVPQTSVTRGEGPIGATGGGRSCNAPDIGWLSRIRRCAPKPLDRCHAAGVPVATAATPLERQHGRGHAPKVPSPLRMHCAERGSAEQERRAMRLAVLARRKGRSPRVT
jgi:hypothetical protein